MHLRRLALFTLVALVTPAFAQHLSADGAAQTFDMLSSQYFEQVYFHFSPTAGTSAGLHQYDTQLEASTPSPLPTCRFCSTPSRAHCCNSR
jgi:hypothetical protein